MQATLPVVRARLPSTPGLAQTRGALASAGDKAGPAWQLLRELLDPASIRSVEFLLTHDQTGLSGPRQMLDEHEITRRLQALAAYARKFLNAGEQRDLLRALINLLGATRGVFETGPQPAHREQAGRAFFTALAQWAWSFKVPMRAEMVRTVFVLPIGRAIDRVAMLILQFSERQQWRAMRCDFPWLFKLACQHAGHAEEDIDLIKALLGLLPPAAPGLSACLARTARFVFHAPPDCRLPIANALWSIPAGRDERLLLSLAQGLQAHGQWLRRREAATAPTSTASLPRRIKRERRAQVSLFNWLARQLLVLYPPGRKWPGEEEHPDPHDPCHRRPRSPVLPVLAEQIGLLPASARQVALDVVSLMNLAFATGWRPYEWDQEG